MKLFTRSILLFAFFILSQISCTLCHAGNPEIANDYFYKQQYEKAISAYTDVLKDNEYDHKTKTNIKYKIGLSYFLIGDRDNSLKYWRDARDENPDIFKGKTFRIPSPGMEPQLIVGDHIIVDTEYYIHKEIQRGDVAVFSNPSDSKTLWIKRVVALPGEKVEMKKKVLKINDKEIIDNNAHYIDKEFYSQRDDYGPLIIPQDSYFLLGDNRDLSSDSRFYGPVPKKYFIGKALIIYGAVPNKSHMQGASIERAEMLIK